MTAPDPGADPGDPAREPGWFADVLLHEAPPAPPATVLALIEQGEHPRDIYMEVLAPALVEIGRRWEARLITVAQEHLASTEIGRLMTTLAPLLGEEPPVLRSIVLAATDGSLHTMGLSMVGDFLAGDGWEVRYLGAGTPPVDLAAFVAEIRVDAVGLSTTLTEHLTGAAETIWRLRALPNPPFILVGGPAWDGSEDEARRLGADAYAHDAAAASQLLRDHFREPDPSVALRRELALRMEQAERHLQDEMHAARRTATLGGTIPVCAWCGRIRRATPTSAEWVSPATYLRDAGLAATASTCPDCAESVGSRTDEVAGEP